MASQLTLTIGPKLGTHRQRYFLDLEARRRQRIVVSVSPDLTGDQRARSYNTVVEETIKLIFREYGTYELRWWYIVSIPERGIGKGKVRDGQMGETTEPGLEAWVQVEGQQREKMRGINQQ